MRDYYLTIVCSQWLQLVGGRLSDRPPMLNSHIPG